jgi:PEP-CTERM motif
LGQYEMAQMKSALLAGAAMAIVALASEPAAAAVVPYTGLDSGWSSAPPVGPTSLATEQSFVAATGASNPITFAGGSYPSGVSISLVNPYGFSSISNAGTGSCGFAKCGGDTDGNGWFLYLYGGSATFTFTKPIDYFGAYLSGVQINDFITWTDSSGGQSVTVPVDLSNGGMAFAGFTDFGQSITSVTISASNDIIGVDDVLYSTSSAIPEPASWAMMLIGFAGLGLACRRVRQSRLAIPTA